jgi:hypothetical protein
MVRGGDVDELDAGWEVHGQPVTIDRHVDHVCACGHESPSYERIAGSVDRDHVARLHQHLREHRDGLLDAVGHAHIVRADLKPTAHSQAWAIDLRRAGTP